MPQNDVDQWAAAATQSLQQTQAEQIRNSVGTALSTNPDQEAQTRRFAAAAMVPLETARALPDTVKQQAQMSTFDAGLLARKFPITAQLVANPDLARITHDDIPATAGVEQAVRALPPAPAQSIDTPHPTQSSLLADAIHYIFSTPGQGDTLVGDAGKIVAGGARALAGTGKYLALADSTLARPIDAVLGTNLQQGALGLTSKLDAYSQSGPGRDASFKDQLLSTVGSTAGVLVEAALTGGASVEPRLGATVMEALGPHIAHGVQAMMVPSAVAAQDTYNSVVEKTGNVVDATRSALASYVTSSLGGVVPFATPGKLAYRMASGALMGPLLGDVSHEVMNAAMPDSMQAPDLTWKERGLDAVMGTMFGGMAGPHDVADIHQRINDAARQSYVDAIRNEADVKSIAALHGLGQVSAVAKLRERDPEAFKQFVESVTEDGHLKEVYVDAKTLTNALNQSGVTDADLQATMPDVLAQLHEASQTNGDVRIPVADYATHIAGGPIDEAILPHLKTDPEGKTYTEAQAAYQGQVESLKGTVDKMLADKGAQDTAQASRSAIRDQVLQQLNEVNRFRPDVNRLHAEVIADHRVTMAERLGMTPEQFSETYPLRFTGETGAGGTYDPTDPHILHQSAKKNDTTPGAGITKPMTVDPTMLVFRESEQHRKDELTSETDEFDPIVVIDDGRKLSILDGHNRASVAIDRGDNLKAVKVSKAEYDRLKANGFEDGEIGWAALQRADQSYAAGNLDSQFPGSDISKGGDKAWDNLIENESTALDNGGSFSQDARGQIGFADDITQQPSVISLLKNADLSTTIHELGHFFLEVNNHLTRQIEARMANGEAATPGEQSVVNDMHTALSWMGVKPTPEMSATDHWAYLPLDEKRHFHENFARGFEAYMMEGKAPSVGLARAFQAFRSWLLNVYKSLTALHVELTPEVRGVFDRMLASDEAIKTAEQVRGYRPLFESASDAGMTPEEFSAYQGLGKEATADATDELQGRSLRDMKWLANAKSKALKDLQKEAAGKRQTAQQEVTKEVMSQPIYRAWTFLTAKDGDRVEGGAPVGDSKGVNPEKDNLFTAIAKLGGLDRAEVKKLWGIDPKEKLDSGVFGAPVVRKTGGLSTEAMAERLMEEGYLLPDEHGKADADKFEALFDDQRRGTDRYSIKRDMAAATLKVPELPEMGFGRLRTQDLRNMFGEGDDAAWRKLSKLRMTSDKGGLHPDIVAEMFGMESGRDLVQKLAEVEHPKQVIEGMTDQRMLEQHGDLVDLRSIERAAEAAIHNEARARFVATELKALAKATGPARALALAAKEAADAAIAAKRVRDLRPAQYTAAEGRAARAAEKALVSGDMPAAAVEKRAQLLNNRLAKAATDALEEVRKGVQYLDKFDKPGVRVNIDLEYRDQIDALLDRYDLRKSTSGKALDKRGALLQFVDRMASQGYEPQIPDALLNEATRMHYKEMPVEDFRGLLDAVKSIEHLGRLKTRLLDLKEMREVQALADEARATTAELPQRAPESNRGLTRMESKWLGVKSAGRSMQAALLKMEQMFDWLDNRNPNGVFNRVVFRRISDAGVHEADLQAQVKAKIDALLHSHLADVTKDGGKIYVAEGLIDGLTGKPQRFAKKEMLSLAGNMGNESNTAKLVKGEKWDEAAVWEFLHKNMGKADWEFVAGLGKTLETIWPEKLAMSRRLGNTNPEKIQPRPFDTPHGPQPGWYWPMVYDPARSQDVAERGAKAGDALFENIYSRANTDTGRMNTRSENYARPLLLSLDTIPRVIKDEIHDVAYREAIMDADKFLGHKDVRSAIQDALSPEHYDQLRPWLQSIANDRKVDMAALKWFDQVAHGARTRATIVGLGYRVSTMLVHGSSAAMESVAELGPKWMGAGLKDFANPLQWSANKDFVFERSGEMRNRMNEVDRDVREHLREIEIRLMDTTEGAVARGTDLMKARAYQGIAMLDMASALPTWMGAYHKAMAAEADGGLGMGEADAVYFADKTVRNAHGGTGAKDLAAVQRGPEFFKLFTMFYTFWNHNVNRLMDTARLAKSLPETFRTGEPGEFKGDLGRVIMRTLIYTLGVQAMHSMLYPSKDAEGDTNWLGWAAKEFTAAAFAGIPVLRDLSAHYLTGKDYAATPAAGIVQAVGNSGTDAMNAMLGKEASPKVLKHTVTTAGYVFGLPLGQPASTAQFLWDVSQGDQNPETVGDWLRGVMHGEMKHR